MRRVRRKGGNKEKVFGCDLLEHLNASSQEIPQVLRCCSEFVETHGIVDGIYRLSGVSSNIQKLRGEFESDGHPDLNKDVYLQDIHCVSSLCKAYFRELPNPLLTYQLYDKFAEAVAIQLEEERLVKIRDVLKELPRPHYRTLEFLMRHLVRMASYSSETNMHARNLAIVWAPNLLRSKDIEASGFNGRAAFMEVRVQSIVVEFILTHVPQLFPEQGASHERRNSLPSPSAASSQEERFFKCAPMQHVPNFGNISPGDGPLPIRPYHAIIEGTDKRKGSLKGRKWMSIFNIGGRFHDPRRRQKHSAKEKDRPVLRPARSMDSLSTPSYPNEGSRRTGQRPPSTNMSTSPLVTSSPQPGSDMRISTGGIGGSEYAVTYRRGTGLVSGGAGTQGTYTALDPEGLGITGNETVQSRSPGLSTKVGRRAAMHITGPTIVTVPLHITSNLALGVLQGGGGDRVIHRSRDKDEGDKAEGKEKGEKVERRESKVEEGRKVEEEELNDREDVMDRKGVVDAEGKAESGAAGEEEDEGKKEEKKEPEVAIGGRSVSIEERAKRLTSSAEDDNEEDAISDDEDVNDIDSYMDMKGVPSTDLQPEVAEQGNDHVSDASDILNSTEVEGDDRGLSTYVQDNFEFLDQMDCSALDHMDCSIPCQVKEFSVEPPGHSDDEYELMEQAQASCQPAKLQSNLQPRTKAHTYSETESNPHRPLDTNSRHTKSLSLPYMTSPVHGPEESCSEEEAARDDSDDNDYNDYSSDDDDDDCMFVKSLPPDFFLSNLDGFEPDTQDSYALDGAPDQSPMDGQFPKPEFLAWEAVEEDKEDKDGLEEKEITKKEEGDEGHQGKDQQQNNRQSKVAEGDHREDTQSDSEQSCTSEASGHHCTAFPLPSIDASSTVPNITAEEETKEVADDPCSDYPPHHAGSWATQEEMTDTPAEESEDSSGKATEQHGHCAKEDTNERDSDEGEDRKIEDVCKEMIPNVKENDEKMLEEASEVVADSKYEETMQEGEIEVDGAICGTGDEIWDELVDVICEVIEDEEQRQAEWKEVREGVAVEKDMIEGVRGEEEEQMAEVSGEEGGTNETGVGMEVVEESAEATAGQLADIMQECEEIETDLPKTSEADEAIQGINDEAQHHDREEVVSKEKENNDGERADDKHSKPPSADATGADLKRSKEGGKCRKSDSSQGGVGRKLVVSKHPKVYQVKAVPVVPPKPQHCKITALTLRQQQQQRERRDADRGRETAQGRVCAGEQGRAEDEGDDGRGRKGMPTLRGGEAERERRRDGDESATRETSRNSPLSMCFDEAVAKATMRRERERECEKERHREWGNEV